MTKTIKIIARLLCVSMFMWSCSEDDNNKQEEQDRFDGCCSIEPAFGANVNNLDQSQGQIIVDNLFTPNNDGINDRLQIENIDLYNNHTVSIYDTNDALVFESTNYNSSANELFPTASQGEFGVEGLADGTYKYKVVVENEQTFLKSGFFCLFTNTPVIEQNFSACNPLAPGEFDPILTGL